MLSKQPGRNCLLSLREGKALMVLRTKGDESYRLGTRPLGSRKKPHKAEVYLVS